MSQYNEHVSHGSNYTGHTVTEQSHEAGCFNTIMNK